MVGKATLCVVATEARAHGDTFPLESVAVLVFGTVRIDGALFEAISFRRIANGGVDVWIFDTFAVFTI